MYFKPASYSPIVMHNLLGRQWQEARSCYLFTLLPASLDTGLPRENVHEQDSGPMQGAIHTQSHNL